jgi:hypothetical protein
MPDVEAETASLTRRKVEDTKSSCCNSLVDKQSWSIQIRAIHDPTTIAIKSLGMQPEGKHLRWEADLFSVALRSCSFSASISVKPAAVISLRSSTSLNLDLSSLRPFGGKDIVEIFSFLDRLQMVEVKNGEIQRGALAANICARLKSVLELQVIPISLSRRSSQFLACKPLLEVIEDSEFVSCHYIGCWVGLNLPPYIRQCGLQKVNDCGISRALGAVPRNFKCLRNICDRRGRLRSCTPIIGTHLHWR